MNLYRWFTYCRKKGHDWTSWKQLEVLPVPFRCCAVCHKDAPEKMQREFFMSWIGVSNQDTKKEKS